MEKIPKASFKQDNIKQEVVFEQLFKTNFKALHRYAFSFVKDRDIAEDIVQQVFLRLWENRSGFEVERSIQAYLYRAVYHACLNHIKHTQVQTRHARYMQSDNRHQGHALADLQAKELKARIACVLADLPEGCRTIFQMSRYESLKYKEIAEALNISVKTVENQMGKALRILRAHLGDYLPLFLTIYHLIKQ